MGNIRKTDNIAKLISKTSKMLEYYQAMGNNIKRSKTSLSQVDFFANK